MHFHNFDYLVLISNVHTFSVTLLYMPVILFSLLLNNSNLYLEVSSSQLSFCLNSCFAYELIFFKLLTFYPCDE